MTNKSWKIIDHFLEGALFEAQRCNTYIEEPGDDQMSGSVIKRWDCNTLIIRIAEACAELRDISVAKGEK